MEYRDYSDSYLIDMINESSEEAKDILYEKYNYIIDIVSKKYIRVANMLGIDASDLKQEALVGFSDGLNRYREDRDASFATFITMCVERRLQVCIIKAKRYKNKVLNESLSLDYVPGDDISPLVELLSDNSQNDPLVNISKEEEYQDLLSQIQKVLSEKEYEVYSLLAANLNYKEIAQILDLELKQVDNSIQRIKNKIKKILVERKN